MAFAHQYTLAGAASATLHPSQVLHSAKPTHSPTSPPIMDPVRALAHESGLSLMHFLPRMNGLAESVYGQGPLNGIEPSAFFPMGSPTGHLPTSPEQWKGMAGQSPVMYPFDPMLAVHPYASFYGGLDLNNAARRKNATRETTSALKAWLYEHRKNPYPTKGEKIMLAIITKMTLTQVSTWFANARRRLKKESKSGWNGKPGELDDSDFETDGEEKINENQDCFNITSRSCSGNDSDDDDVDIKVTSDLSDISDAETDRDNMETRTGNRLECNPVSSAESAHINRQFNSVSPSDSVLSNNSRHTNSIASPSNPAHRNRHNNNPSVNNEQTVSSREQNAVAVSPVVKPKIWSIDEIMNKDSTKPKQASSNGKTSSSKETESTSYLQNTENQTPLDSLHNQRYTSTRLTPSSSSTHTVSQNEIEKSTRSPVS